MVDQSESSTATTAVKDIAEVKGVVKKADVDNKQDKSIGKKAGEKEIGSETIAAGGDTVGSTGKPDEGNAKKVKSELVIPDEPVKRYPQPDRNELKNKIDEQDALIKAAVARLDSTRGFYDERNKLREAGRDEFQTEKKKQNELHNELRAKIDNAKSLSSQISQLRDNNTGDKSGANREEIPSSLKGCKNVEDVDARIRELEYRHSTASLSIQEEKKLVSDIAYLKHKGRSFLADREKSASAEKMAREQRISKRKELEAMRREQDKDIDKLKTRLDKQRAVVTDIRKKQDKEIEALASKYSDVDRDAERKKIGEARSEIKKIRDNYTAELDKWRTNERIYREQVRRAKQKKYEAMQAEREARRLAYEAEMAKYPKPHPYQKEKDLCNSLITYLNSLVGIDEEKDTKILTPEKSDVPSLSKSLPAREITAGKKAGKAIGKKADEDSSPADQTFGSFVKAGGKKGGKKGRKKGRRLDLSENGSKSSAPSAASGENSNASLPSHSMERFKAFGDLGIKPPTKKSEVSKCIETLKEKISYFDSKPPPEESEKKEESKEPKPAAKQPKKKPAQDAGDLTGKDYPLMNGGGIVKTDAANGTGNAEGDHGSKTDNADVSSEKRVSYADIMAGKAKAPPQDTANEPGLETYENGEGDANGVTEHTVNNEPHVSSQGTENAPEASPSQASMTTIAQN